MASEVRLALKARLAPLGLQESKDPKGFPGLLEHQGRLATADLKDLKDLQAFRV